MERQAKIGSIAEGKIFNAKGHFFSLAELLGGDVSGNESFLKGSYITFYLSPCDYHRVHMPIRGILKKMTYVPGKLFSVQNAYVNTILSVFSKNERLIVEFETIYGPMIVILVGAMIVAGIHTTWHGHITREKKIRQWQYPSEGASPIILESGAELGHFSVGSSVLLLFPGSYTLTNCAHLFQAKQVCYGEALGSPEVLPHPNV